MAVCQEQPARPHRGDDRTRDPCLVPHFHHSITSKQPAPSRPAATAAALEAGLHAHKPLAKSCNFHWSRGLGNAKDGLVPPWQPWQRKIPFRNPHIYQPCAGGREWGLGVYSPFVRNVSFHKEQAGSQLTATLWPRVSPSAAPENLQGGGVGLQIPSPGHSPGATPQSLGWDPGVRDLFFLAIQLVGSQVPNQGLNPRPLHQNQSQPLDLQGSPECIKLPQ